jgi:transposase
MVRLVAERGQSVREVSETFGVSRQTVHKWIRRHREGDHSSLENRSCRPHKTRRKYPLPTDQTRTELFAILHAPPSDFGLNRTTWRVGDLVSVLRLRGHLVNEPMVSGLIKESGYRWKQARVVLTSNDRKFRKKLDRVRETVAGLREDQAFFSVDEFGPLAIRMRGGRALVPPGGLRSVPQWQKTKGSLIVTAALELATNQVSHFYSKRKNTGEMTLLLEKLADEYRDRRTLFITWDAAPWHRSRQLFEFIRQHNDEAARSRGPSIRVVPLPARAQFLNVIESVFSGMARAIVHNSDYPLPEAARAAINRYFAERNDHFRRNPRRAGKKIWGHERVPSEFSEGQNCKDPAYR